MSKDQIRIGPLIFQFEPDGDDPGTGWIVIVSGLERTRLQSTPAGWKWFLEAAQ